MQHNWHEVDRLRERIWRAIAWRLPRGLAYWAAVRVNTEATTTRFTDKRPEEVSIIDALTVWN